MKGRLLDAIPLSTLTGVGASQAGKLAKLGLFTIQDLLLHLLVTTSGLAAHKNFPACPTAFPVPWSAPRRGSSGHAWPTGCGRPGRPPSTAPPSAGR